MKLELHPYPEYKDSGLPWLGKIPKHWNVIKLRNLLKETTRRNRPDLPLLSVVREKGVIVRNISSKEENRNYIPDDLSNYKVVHRDQFAMNKMKAWQGSYGISKHNGIVSPAYYVFNLKGVNPDYFHKAIRSKAYIPFFTQASDGVRIGQWDLSIPRMREIPFAIPSPEEQKIIANYLDIVSAKINRFIRNRQQLIKVLNEQKQAIITQYVTGKLDPSTGKPYPKYKPSGVDWLGDIPEHWEVRRICRCIKSVTAGVWGDDPDESNTEDHIICVRVADFNMENMGVSSSKLTIRAISQEMRKSQMLCHGDILLEKSGGGEAEPVGRVVLFNLNEPAVCSNFISRIITDLTIVSPRFMLYVLTLIQGIRRNVPSIKQTTGIQNLDEQDYFSNLLCIPPKQEQERIISWLDDKVGKIQGVQRRAFNDIILIREYRNRLITDVVTGKLDVRQASLGLNEDLAGIEEDLNIDDESIEDEESDMIENADDE